MVEFTRTQKTTAQEVGAALHDYIKGKTILITGVSPYGLGAACAEELAAHEPKLLILASRDAAKVTVTEANITSRYPNIKTRQLILDLSSLEAVRAAANELLSENPPLSIDVLINNAALMACPYHTTKDGFEAQFGTNHLGHFVFTNEIMPLILSSSDKRIVNVSSYGHTRSAIRWDDVGFSEGKAYEKWEAYGQAKTANILFSVALAERLGKKGVKSFSLHPGGILTPLQRHLEDGELPRLIADVKKTTPDFYMKNLSEGSATHIVAGFDPSILDKNGAYLDDCHIEEPSEWAKDPKDAEKLWKLSEKMVGKEYNY